MSDARTELEKRVKALEEAVDVEMSALDPPTYTEEDLVFLYDDLLALPATPEQEKKVEVTPAQIAEQRVEEDIAVVNAAEQRFEHAKDAVSRVEAARVLTFGSQDNVIPVTLLSIAEYQSLLRLSTRAKDVGSAELTLSLMKHSGLPIPENMITSTMELYARAGNVAGLEQVIAGYLTDFPTGYQRHLHIKSHLVSTLTDVLPTSALEVLHSYESQAHPAPVQSYTSVIASLFSTKSSLGRAQAWDLFSHMRYVAHADPDVPLYTAMIRACASPLNTRPSEPEKALDLWTEMTVDRRLSPTAGAYDAVILACARSGTTMFVNEAFRLAKQMLDTHRDARGESAFAPSRRTFCALLEGAKRVGDLARARWILAQMIAETRMEEGVNEEVMMHVFHSYASYRPPFKRSDVRTLQGSSAQPVQDTSTSGVPSSPTAHEPPQSSDVGAYDSMPTFTQIPPQSGAEVIHEVQILFNRILHDIGLQSHSDPTLDNATLPSLGKFRGVQLTPRLLNSYLSVHYRHASLETTFNLYRQVFSECRVSPTGRSYVEALERCANARRGHERTVALQFGEEVWEQWQRLEETGQEGERALSRRTIEKAYIAMIRLLSLTNNVDRAVQLLRAFAARYPPSDVRIPAPKSALRSTRTALVGQRPLVRMTSAVEVPDDHVPPLVMFDDVEILHHRLVARNARTDIAFLSYICKAYEGALRARRDAALKMKPDAVQAQGTSPAARLSSPSP
ncbi:hypothetical protein DXG03_004218 [Asterophora parasitica]|uniref:Pentatricopeptide repeat protein n=1 Tax=Asterophora parasitica TaxID=117018 RepID=A0A9P7GF42_9AGAR|nr:hypothetical protein DXG03_004218 [Asterophora parasitica]